MREKSPLLRVRSVGDWLNVDTNANDAQEICMHDRFAARFILILISSLFVMSALAVKTAAAPKIVKADQTIAFPPLTDATYGAPPFAVTATASSGLPVSLASLTPDVCAVSGFVVTPGGAGTCRIAASQ